MSDYSSAQEELTDSEKHGDMLVVDDDAANGMASASESVDLSDEDLVQKGDPSASHKSLQEIKQIAFHKPSLSLTLVTEGEDGSVTMKTEEYDNDQHVTLILENDEDAIEPTEQALKYDDDVEEDLGEALKDMAIMSSLVKSEKFMPKKKTRTASMKRRMGIIVNSSESEDDDFINKIALMPPTKSDDTPVLTVPAFLADECLTDVENIDE